MFIFVSLFFILFFSNISTAFASDRYWIGGTGNWSDTAHWSDSDGGGGGFSVPTSIDNVYFSVGSFSVDGAVVTVDTTANTASLDFSTIDQTMTLVSSVNSMNVYGSLILSNKLTWTFSGTAYLNMKATTPVNITSAGSIITNAIYLNGVGGTFTLLDDFSVGGQGRIWVVNGTFNTNDKTVTAGFYIGSTAGVATINFGSSIINAGLYFTAPITINPGASTIISGGWLYSSSMINLNNVTYMEGGYGALITNITCNNFTYNNINKYMNLSGSLVVNGILNINGFNDTTRRLVIYSNTIGTQRTITVNSANVIASNVDFRDIKFQNPVDLSGISGGSGDAGGNTGITFTTAQPQFFKHTSGAVSWSDSTKWFSDQAKTIAGRVPLPQDDATFDAGSFTGASTLTVNVPRIGRSLDMNAVNQTINMSITSTNVESYGSFILGNTVTTNSGIILYGYDGTYYINIPNTIGYKSSSGFNVLPRNATYIFNSDVTVNSTIYLNPLSGSFIDTNNKNITVNSLHTFNLVGSGTINLKNSTLTDRRSNDGPCFIISNNNIIYGTSTLKCDPSGGSGLLTFSNSSSTQINRVWISGTGTNNIDFSNNNHRISELIIDPGRKVRFTAGTTQQIGKLTAIGTAVNPITIGSITNATHTLNFTGTGNAVGDYLNLSYSTATPANKWFASHSTNSGNNTGWTFANAPDAPTAVGASIGNAQVALSWSIPGFDGGSAITDYVIEYKLSSEPTTWSVFSDGVTTNTNGTVVGLTNGLSYDFRISAVNLIGQGVASSIVTATPITVPDAPISVVATRGNAQASIAFQVPPSDGGSPITNYTVTSIPESHIGTGNASPIMVTGLTNGTAYTFTVTATNIAGTGQSSSISNSVTPATIPDAPTSPIAIAGNAQVSLSWTSPIWNGGTEITDYVIEYKLSSEPTIWSVFSDGITPNTNTIVNGLINGLSYDFRIYSVNDVGQGSQSLETSSMPVTVPDAPTAVSGVAGNAQVSVSFTPPIFNGGSTINSYTVTSNPGNFTATGNASLIIVTGLTNGTAYTFTVTATNAVGESLPSSLSSPVIPITVPDAPTSVLATEGNTQASISFTPPVFDGGTPITSYTAISTPGGFTGTGINSPIMITGLTNGTTYTFKVKATNIVGDGPLSSSSNQVTLSTEPSAPVNLASTVLGSSIGLSWSEPSSDGGTAIIDYVIEYQLSTGGVWAVFADGLNTNTTATVVGLSNGTSYDFRVLAVNIIGESIPSSVVTATPGEPAQVLVQNFSDLTVSSIGTVVRITNEGSADYEYQYTWCITSSAGNLCGGGDDLFSSTAAKLISHGENWDTTLVSTLLTPGDYYFHIKVLYGSESSNAYQSFTSLATYPDVPLSPIAASGNAEAVISFTPPVFDGGSAITSYTATSNPEGITGSSLTSPVTVTGLTNGTEYTFTVVATNIIGTSMASSPSNFVIPVTIPDAPTGVTAIAGDKKVTLSWIAPLNNGGTDIVDYIIEYKLSADSIWSIFSKPISPLTTIIVTGLTNNLSYDFRVSAVNIVGQSLVDITNTTTPESRKNSSSGYIIPPKQTQPQIKEIENIIIPEKPNKLNTPVITRPKKDSSENPVINIIKTEPVKNPELPTDDLLVKDNDINDNEVSVTPKEKSSEKGNNLFDKIKKIAIPVFGIIIGGGTIWFLIFKLFRRNRLPREVFYKNVDTELDKKPKRKI